MKQTTSVNIAFKGNIKSDPVEVPFANVVLKELQWTMNSLTKKSCDTEIGYFQVEFFRYGCPNEYIIPLNYFWWCDTSVKFESSHLAEKYVEEQLKNRVKRTLQDIFYFGQSWKPINTGTQDFMLRTPICDIFLGKDSETSRFHFFAPWGTYPSACGC